MLCWMMPFLVAIFALVTAAAADGQPAKSGVRRAASQLPAGLPRANYKFRTTIARATPSPFPVYVAGGPEVLFTPTSGYLPYVPFVAGAVPPPGYAAFTNEYGQPIGLGYQDSWYGGVDVDYWGVQPYGCGGYGYGYGYC